MDAMFWTRLTGKMRGAARELGPEAILELLDAAERAREEPANEFVPQRPKGRRKEKRAA